jgi:hypothetical protein
MSLTTPSKSYANVEVYVGIDVHQRTDKSGRSIKSPKDLFDDRRLSMRRDVHPAD